MSSLKEKIKKSISVICEAQKLNCNAIMSTSFGKDSMVVLHMLRELNLEIPCLFGREPFCPKKYEFADTVIRDWNLVCYNIYFPNITYLQECNGEIEVVGYYSFANGSVFTLPTGIIESDDFKNDCLCGLDDLYNKPLGVNQFPWNMNYIGYKDSDNDIVLGACKTKDYIHYNDEVKLYSVFPLKDWTDDDIWEYSERYDVPQNYKRYPKDRKDKNLFRNQLKDVTYNPDYFLCCTKCINKNYSKLVYCAKKNTYIENISDRIRYINAQVPPSMERI